MKFTGFDIKNFKGIGSVSIRLDPPGANVFTLIGLNESGKTTILEAINQHSVHKLDSLYGDDNAPQTSEELARFVPRSEQSDFSDEIIIAARLAFLPGEKSKLIRAVEAECGCQIEHSSLPSAPILTRKYIYKDSDYKSFESYYNFHVNYKPARAKKYRSTTNDSDVWKSLVRHLRMAIPTVAYFPTFLFNQPERIYLTAHEGESASNALYRTIIENIGASLPRPLDIQRHLVDRIINEETWVNGVFSLFGLARSKQQQITAAKNEIATHLTQTVYESWAKTFGGDFGGREILLNVDVEIETGKEPLAYATFEVKDDGGQYEIRERSLGFRWFFSFILFTLYGTNRNPGQQTLFLLDEPASNLHSRAQMQLLESFRRISAAGNQIIYSTHSHYMVNPDWLDQAFIVSNSAIDYGRAYQNDNVSAKTSITAQPCKKFVGVNPDQVTYFQPVLDKLDVSISRFDIDHKSVLVEGKGDYRLLEYALEVILEERKGYHIVPTRGAAGMDELIGLFLGWGVTHVICLDDDTEGRRARERYLGTWGLPEARVFTLGDVHKDMERKRLEGFLDPDDLSMVANHFSVEKPSKEQIGLFFAEKLATGEAVPLSSPFRERVRAFHECVQTRLNLDPPPESP